MTSMLLNPQSLFKLSDQNVLLGQHALQVRQGFGHGGADELRLRQRHVQVQLDLVHGQLVLQPAVLRFKLTNPAKKCKMAVKTVLKTVQHVWFWLKN